MSFVEDTPTFRSWVIGLLKDETKSAVHITFTKADGTERTLNATLVEAKIPAAKLPKSETTTKVADTALRVFDVELQDWRAFKWDSVLNVVPA